MRKELAACVDVREYSKPESREVLLKRVRSNLGNFRLIYGTTIAFFFVYFLLTSPFLLGGLILIAALWIYFFQIKNADDVVNIGGYQLGQKEKLMVMVPLTLFVALFGGVFSYFFYVGVASGVVILAHASFRKEIEVDPLDELADLPEGDNFV